MDPCLGCMRQSDASQKRGLAMSHATLYRSAARKLVRGSRDWHIAMTQYQKTLSWYADTSEWSESDHAYALKYLSEDRREMRLLIKSAQRKLEVHRKACGVTCGNLRRSSARKGMSRSRRNF